jgi:hypothetical protein
LQTVISPLFTLFLAVFATGIPYDEGKCARRYVIGTAQLAVQLQESDGGRRTSGGSSGGGGGGGGGGRLSAVSEGESVISESENGDGDSSLQANNDGAGTRGSVSDDAVVSAHAAYVDYHMRVSPLIPMPQFVYRRLPMVSTKWSNSVLRLS